MQVFEYRARNRQGELMSGTLESTSAQAVAAWLIGTEVFPVSIKPRPPGYQEPLWLTRLLGKDRVTAVHLLVFTRQMANMVRAGLKMLEAIDGIQKTSDSPALARVLRAVRDDMDRGLVLSAGMARHPRVFDDYYVNMIRVGETTGKLEEVFRSLASQLEFDREMSTKMKAAMRYPIFVMSALAVALTVVSLFVIPSFAKTYANLKVDLPLLTRALLAISAFAVQYWWLVGLTLVAGISTFKAALRSPDTRYAWDRFKLRLPVVGPVMTKATVARFARSFSTALKANVPIVTAFQLVSRVVDNSYYAARIVAMRAGVERGEVLSRVMRNSAIFSPLELQLIYVAERTGEVDRAVDEVAKLYTEEVEYQVARMNQTIEPLLLALMGVLVALLVLGVFMPMWQLGQAHFKN